MAYKKVRAEGVHPIAMVQAPPTNPNAKRYHKLLAILTMMGNDRAFTIVQEDKYFWKVMFEGDDEPTMIEFDGEKPDLK